MFDMEHLQFYLTGVCQVIEYNHPLVRELEFVHCNLNNEQASYLSERLIFDQTFRDLVRFSFNGN